MNVQAARTAPLQATKDICTFVVQEIRAVGRVADSFGRDRPWYEALIRPRGQYRHWSPAAFIDHLYQHRAEVRTDLKVLQRLAAWLIGQEQPTRLSINIHPESFIHASFVDAALEAQRRAFQGGHSICLELIEFGRSSAQDTLVANARVLRRAGLLIALDDFGSRVNCFDLCAAGIVDLLKIDADVTCGVQADGNRRAIVNSIVTLGRGLGAGVIAEGVESAREAAALCALEVDYAQGFHFHKPRLLEI